MPSSNDLTDTWTELKKGNRDALLQLYRSHYVGLMNYGISFSGDRELTKDCITQVLLRLWDGRHKLPAVSNVRSYLLTCLHNELTAEWRRVKSRHQKLRELAAGNENAEKSYEELIVSRQSGEEQKKLVANAISSLTPREQELLRLRFFEDKGYEEIASDCGITKRTAYNIIHAALKALKSQLTKPLAGLLLHWLAIQVPWWVFICQYSIFS